MLDHTQQLASMITAALTHVSQEQALEMVAGGYALVAGLWPMSNPPAELAAVLEGPEVYFDADQSAWSLGMTSEATSSYDRTRSA
jgi:hypothetical protein